MARKTRRRRRPAARRKDPRLDAVLKGKPQGFCFIPFVTMGVGRVRVNVWPAPVPPAWPPARQAYARAFGDALQQAHDICDTQPKCPNVLFLRMLRPQFFRQRVFRRLPPPLPRLFLFNVVICVVVCWWMCVPEAPEPEMPELEDDQIPRRFRDLPRIVL